MSYQNYRYNTADIMLGFYTKLTQSVNLTGVYEARIGKDLKAHMASLTLDYIF